MKLTAQLLLEQGSAVKLGFIRRRVGRVATLELRSLILDLLLKYRDIFLQCLLRRICSTSLALEAGYSALHLLLLDLPRVAIPLVAMPFGLEKAHNTCASIEMSAICILFVVFVGLPLRCQLQCHCPALTDLVVCTRLPAAD